MFYNGLFLPIAMAKLKETFEENLALEMQEK